MEKYIDKKTNKVVIKVNDDGKTEVDKEWKDKKKKEKEDGNSNGKS
jgi:hypothetical protein